MQDLIKYSIIATFQTKVWQQNTIFVYTSWDIVWTRPLLCGTMGLIREKMENLEIFPFGKLVRFVSTVSKYNLHIGKDEGKFKFSDKSHLFNFLPRFLHFPKVRRSRLYFFVTSFYSVVFEHQNKTRNGKQNNNSLTVSVIGRN